MLEQVREFGSEVGRIVGATEQSAAARRDKAQAIFASMVGAVVLARSVDDPALAEQILQSVAASITGSSPARS